MKRVSGKSRWIQINPGNGYLYFATKKRDGDIEDGVEIYRKRHDQKRGKYICTIPWIMIRHFIEWHEEF